MASSRRVAMSGIVFSLGCGMACVDGVAAVA
jgi:hypothetical protein